MLWGARSLAHAATMILLLELSNATAAVTMQRTSLNYVGTGAAVAAADRHKRDSDSLHEVLIEHVNSVDEPQAALSLYIGFLILGAIILVVLIFLACLLLIRLSERRPAKYHRLCSRESLGPHRRSRTDNVGPSQVFTYVDLSSANGGCQNHRDDCQHAQAPRFSAIFTTAANVSARDTDSRREPKRRRTSSARTSRLVTMGLPSVVSAVDTPSARRVRSQDDTINVLDVNNVLTQDRMAEPPKKRVCVQHVTAMPTQRSGGVETAEGIDIYGDRCAEPESGVPQMEIKVRDRVVKIRPTGTGLDWSPVGSGLAHRADETAAGSTTVTRSRYYPESVGTYAVDSSLGPPLKDGSWSEIISPLFSPDETAKGPPIFPSLSNPLTSSANVPDDSSRLRPERMELSGHGRFYEQHIPGEESRTAAMSDVKPGLASGADSYLVHGNAAMTPSEDTLRRHISALRRTSNAELGNRNGTPAPSNNSQRLHTMIENETSHVKQALIPLGKPVENSTAGVTPVKIKANVTLQRVPSQVPSPAGSPSHNQRKELSVQLPEMIAYFDRPEKTKSFKATIDASSAGNVATKVSSPEAKWMTPPAAEGSPSPSSSDDRARSTKLRLPQPPVERRGEIQAVPSPSEISVVVAPPSARKQRDGRSSTHSHSLDDVPQQRASLPHTFSESEIRSVDVDKRKVLATMSSLIPRSDSSLVASHSGPSKEAISAPNDKGVEPQSAYRLPETRHYHPESFAKPPDNSGQLPSILAEEVLRIQTVDSSSASTDLAARAARQSQSYPSSLELPKSSRALVVSAEENVQTNVSPVYADPIAMKAEITVDGAWPIVTADDKHMQPLVLNEAISEGPTSLEVVNRDQSSGTGTTNSSALQCAPERKILDKEYTQPPERELDHGKKKLTAVTQKAAESSERAVGQLLVAEPVRSIAMQTESTNFAAESRSQESPSGAELSEQPSLPASHVISQTPSESATKLSADESQVATLPANQTEVVSLSPSSSQTDSAVAQSRPSEIKDIGTSRGLATSSERNLNLTLSARSTSGRELEPSLTQKVTLVPPSSSTSGGAVHLMDQSTEPVLQTAESSHVLAVSDARNGTQSTEGSVAVRKVAEREQSTHDTTIMAREDHPGPSHTESTKPLPLSERAESTEVFFGTTSPVPSQGSRDLISFNTEPNIVEQIEKTVDKSTGAEGRIDGDSPPQKDPSTEESSK